MNELHQAYQIFRLPIGSPWDAVKRRYRRLAGVWHPDRAPSEDARHDMEEDLKVINNTFDVFKKHFNGGEHMDAPGCCCQTSERQHTTSDAARPGPGPGPSAQTDQESQWKATAEQQTREEASRQAEGLARKTAAERLRRQERQRRCDAFQWKVAAFCGAAFILLCGFCSLSGQLQSWCHNRPSDSTRSDSATTTGSSAPASTTPSYLPPYEQPRSIGPDDSNVLTSPRVLQHQQLQRQDPEAQKKNQQDIYFTKLEIDRHQKAIEQCQSNITDIDTRLADPNLSYVDRPKLNDLKAFRQRTLQREQADLESAQAKLRELDTTAKLAIPQTQLQPPDPPATPLVSIPHRNSLFPPVPPDSRFGPPLDPDSPR